MQNELEMWRCGDGAAELIQDLQQEIQEYQNALNIQILTNEEDVQQLTVAHGEQRREAQLELGLLQDQIQSQIQQLRETDDQVQMGRAQIIDLQERHEVELVAMEELVQKSEAELYELRLECGRDTGKRFVSKDKGVREQHVEAKQVEDLNEGEMQDLMQSFMASVAAEAPLEPSMVKKATNEQESTTNMVTGDVNAAVCLEPAAPDGPHASQSASVTAGRSSQQTNSPGD